ncbi:hypothetical protein COLO4_02270 [Corchorus olitorius]|uniref:Uncharacterized protein n=1 Tax=Corchorus olitorius TaxID=93759 RepID=A0A1R3L0I9_9ROSI|nr:hypothetical protein COLO4_02689 [Corchorus olitorius]OMP12948.1 hypothetical protein COLO4_02535 [Corchorus olitorius]OMP13104.1 hypothetical protein COLO4_02270 [Corchorus olitorius]
MTKLSRPVPTQDKLHLGPSIQVSPVPRFQYRLAPPSVLKHPSPNSVLAPYPASELPMLKGAQLTNHPKDPPDTSTGMET